MEASWFLSRIYRTVCAPHTKKNHSVFMPYIFMPLLFLKAIVTDLGGGKNHFFTVISTVVKIWYNAGIETLLSYAKSSFKIG